MSTSIKDSSFKDNLLLLPDDVLFVILSFLNQRDLCRLCQVCKRLNYLSSKDCVWSQHAADTVLLKLSHNRGQSSLKEMCRIAPNWKNGKFHDRYVLKHKVRHIPWLQMEGQRIWFSTGSVIRCLKCRPDVSKVSEDTKQSLCVLQSDVSRFVVKGNLVVAGTRDGSVHGWHTTGESLFHYDKIHQSDTHCVDMTDNCIVSGSKDGTCKILPLPGISPSSNSLNIQTVRTGDRVWCLQSSPCQRFFVAGLAGYHNETLVRFNIERGEHLGFLNGGNSKRGAGILDMKFESENELLTCGYDTFIRLWDLRTDSCVAQWEEPYDSSLYCLETDGSNAIAVGTARHGMVRLWDKRQTQHVQMFYSTGCSSPVYALALDYGHLYLALDMGLSLMDFTGTSAQSTRHYGHRPR